MNNLINGYAGKEIGFIDRPNKPRFIIREIYKEIVRLNKNKIDNENGVLYEITYYNNGTFEKRCISEYNAMGGYFGNKCKLDTAGANTKYKLREEHNR